MLTVEPRGNDWAVLISEKGEVETKDDRGKTSKVYIMLVARDGWRKLNDNQWTLLSSEPLGQQRWQETSADRKLVKEFSSDALRTDSPNNEDKMKRTLVIPALLLLAASAAAQTAPAPTKNPVSAALRDILPGRQKNTVAAVEAMPADKFNYKPSADQMTFGHLVVHMAETNYLLCSKAAAVPAPKVEE